MYGVSYNFGNELKLPYPEAKPEPRFSSTQRFRLPIAKISTGESLTKNYRYKCL
jgi:hypothetical protein